MSRPPIFSGKEILKTFYKLGFYIHNRKGRHVTLKRDNPPSRVTVLDTPHDVGLKLFHKIVREADITLQEFLNKT